MPYPENMVYLRYDFSWKTTPEIQTFGLWGIVRNEGTGSFGEWQVLVDSLATLAVDAWFEEMGMGFYSLGVKATRAIAYHYRQDHKEVLHRGEAGFDGAKAWAGTANSSMPPQNTVVASLYGYDPSGFATQRARKRGRVYLPTPSPAVIDGTGQMPPGTTGSWADVVRDWLNALTAVIPDSGGGIVSEHHFRPVVSSVAGQMATDVTHIRVGSVIDTQRRRRAQLTEVYENRAINT